MKIIECRNMLNALKKCLNFLWAYNVYSIWIQLNDKNVQQIFCNELLNLPTRLCVVSRCHQVTIIHENRGCSNGELLRRSGHHRRLSMVKKIRLPWGIFKLRKILYATSNNAETRTKRKLLLWKINKSCKKSSERPFDKKHSKRLHEMRKTKIRKEVMKHTKYEGLNFRLNNCINLVKLLMICGTIPIRILLR